MFRNIFKFCIAVMILAVAGFGSIGISPTFAQEDLPPKDSSCIGCHEDQYQLYDHGKWYCLCKTPVRCTECHGGRTDTAIQELAHEGMNANPLVGNGAVCQGCHPADYQARVEKFASIAGVSSTPRPCPTCTPSVLVSGLPPESGGGTRLLRALPPGPWQTLGISLFGISFMFVFLFACRCWKVDHPCKMNGQEGG
jgi:hypothetical protein